MPSQCVLGYLCAGSKLYDLAIIYRDQIKHFGEVRERGPFSKKRKREMAAGNGK